MYIGMCVCVCVCICVCRRVVYSRVVTNPSNVWSLQVDLPTLISYSKESFVTMVIFQFLIGLLLHMAILLIMILNNVFLIAFSHFVIDSFMLHQTFQS